MSSTEIELTGVQFYGPPGAMTTLITTGDLDSIEAHLPADVAAITVTPASDGFRTMPPVLAANLPAAGRRVVIAMGSIDNAEAHAAAERLGDFATAAGLVVTYLTKIDDLPSQIAAFPEEKRTQVLAGLIEQGIKKLPARKASRQSAVAAKMDYSNARILHGSPENPYVLAEFGAWITRTKQVWDDRSLGRRDIPVTHMHDLIVVYRHPQTGALIEKELFDVEDSLLANPTAWLHRLKYGTSIIFDSGQGAEKAIATAVRAARVSEIKWDVGYNRHGWVLTDSGDWGYLTEAGAITAAGLDDSVTTISDNKLKVRTSAPTPGARPWDYWGHALDMINTTAAAALAGVFGATFAGWQPSGTVLITGRPESGKTVMSGIITPLTDKRIRPGASMTTFDGSAANIRSNVQGMHSALLVVDDKRATSDSSNGRETKEQTAQREAMESLLRLGYSGPESAYSVQSQKKDSKGWSNAESPQDWPGLVMIAEAMPEGTPRSSQERLLVIPVTKETSFNGGTADEMKKFFRDPANFESVLFDYLVWVSERRAGLSEAEWQTVGMEYRAAAEADMKKLHPQFTSRTLEVAGFYAAGCALLMEYIQARDPFANTPAALVSAVRLIADAQKDHWDRMDANTTEPWKVLLSVMRSAVATGRVVLYDKTPGGSTANFAAQPVGSADEHAKPLGFFYQTRAGVKFLAIFPEEAIRLHPRYAHTMTAQQLLAAFADVGLSEDGTRNGWRIKTGTGRVQMLALPLDVWYDMNPEDGEDGEVVA